MNVLLKKLLQDVSDMETELSFIQTEQKTTCSQINKNIKPVDLIEAYDLIEENASLDDSIHQHLEPNEIDDISHNSSNSETSSNTSCPGSPIPTSWTSILSLEEMMDIETIIYDCMEDYMENQIETMYSPTFHKTMIIDITYLLNSILLETNDKYKETDSHELEYMIETICSTFFETNELIPVRSYMDSFPSSLLKQEIETIKKQIEYLRTIPQPKQRTPEWYEFRHQIITASNIWKVFGSENVRNSLIYEKCLPYHSKQDDSTSSGSLINNNGINLSNSSLHYGIKYEPVSVKIYEMKYKTKIEDFGCIRHAKYPFIGASPDGINVMLENPLDPQDKIDDKTIISKNGRFGRMIEVKNIYNRVINGIPKQEYWIQMQIQMETCDLNECDFIETRFKEYENEEMFYKNKTSTAATEPTNEIEEDTCLPEYKGVILYFIEKPFPKTIDKLIQRVDKLETPFLETNTSNNSIEEPEKDNKMVMTEPGSHYVYMEPIHKDKSISKKEIDDWINLKTKELSSKYNLYETSYWYLDTFSCVLVKRNREWFQSVLPKFQDFWNIIEKERVDGYEHRISSRLKQKKEKQLIVKQGDACNENIIFDDSVHSIDVPKNNNYLIIKLEH